MSTPTLKEYTEAKEAYKNYCSWIRMSREIKNELIDNLAKERRNEVFYLEQIEKQLEIMRAYETYEEISKGGEG